MLKYSGAFKQGMISSCGGVFCFCGLGRGG